MKIEQNLQTGEVFYKLNSGKEYNTDDYLFALLEFVKVQAIETFRHTQEYRRLVHRVNELERQLSNL
ncbi:MAG TPA: hypothetical protein VEX17_03680 [Bacillales bacterium]|nr:hypothetical protein [Bacillales bacterium]